MQKLEIKISELTSQLSNASMYKEMYERSQKDFEQEQKQTELKLNQRDTEIMELNDRLHKYEDSEQDLKLKIEGLNETIKELEEAAKRPASRHSSRERSPSPDTNLDEMLELRKQLRESKSKLEQTSESLDSLKAELDELKITNKKYQDRIVDKEIEITNLEKEVASLRE